MTYNRFLYNEALYNAGREEVGAIAKSIIQAHTGPHIQAVTGSDGGVTFISDFNIIEGTVRKLPTCFNFPDLKAAISAVQAAIDNLGGTIVGLRFFDMPACVFPVAFIPNLQGVIFALGQADLGATILGKLAEKDLPAIIQVVVDNLGGIMTGIPAPTLFGQIFGQAAPNLGAIIWSPTDLAAILTAVNAGDMGGTITPIQFHDLPGTMLGIPAPNLGAFLRGNASQTDDLGGVTLGTLSSGDMGGFLTVGKSTGDMAALIGTAALGNMPATINGLDFDKLFDLQATIDFFGAKNLQGTIGALALGANDKFMPAALQPITPADLAAVIELNANVQNLGAVLLSLHDTADLGAFLRVSETFVTAILTVSTLASSSLRATIGNPDCAGGSATASLLASAVVQHAGNLRAKIDSFLSNDLGAVINTNSVFFAIDFVDISFSPFNLRPTTFFTTDTISITFSPFRGQNLGAFINATQVNSDLGAQITATFPLPRAVPQVSRITAADIRTNRELDIQEIRLQLEGALMDYFYVNGTDLAFIKDPNELWRINVRSFQPIAAGIFGDFAAARICRLGNLTSFSTMDEAVRSCIAAVIGLEGEAEITASITATGFHDELTATLEVGDVFDNMPAKLLAGQNDPELSATITGIP